MFPDWFDIVLVALVPLLGLAMIVRPELGSGSKPVDRRSNRSWGLIFLVLGSFLLLRTLIPG